MLRSSLFSPAAAATTTTIHPVQRVVFLDFDDTIVEPERDPQTNQYIVSKTRFIKAKLLDLEKFKECIRLAHDHHVPLFIVTARPEIDESIELIHSLIKIAGGYPEDDLISGADSTQAESMTIATRVGGFKREGSIHFTGSVITLENGDTTYAPHPDKTKQSLIESIYNEYYSHLNRSDCLFVDDLETFLAPVRAQGFSCLQADPKTLEHFDEIKNFITGSRPQLSRHFT